MSCCATEQQKAVRPRSTRWLQWVPTDEDQLQDSEARFLASLRGRYSQQEVAGLNTVSQVVSGPIARHVVLVHGFGGGLAMWLPTLVHLFDKADREAAAAPADTGRDQIHAIDMPGFARSSRGPTAFASPAAALGHLTGEIRRWWGDMGFAATDADRGEAAVWLVGHSFGAFVSAHYAMRFPAHVQGLVLADPWGVAPMPPDFGQGMPLRYRAMIRVAEKVQSPFAALRAAGPLGPALFRRIRRDFATRWEQHLSDPEIFYAYIFHCNASSEATGEALFKSCTVGPAFAATPLITDLPERLAAGIPVALIYGENTWMDRGVGQKMADALIQHRAQAGAAVMYATVPAAGHQVFSDNAAGFNRDLDAALLIR